MNRSPQRHKARRALRLARFTSHLNLYGLRRRPAADGVATVGLSDGAIYRLVSQSLGDPIRTGVMYVATPVSGEPRTFLLK